METIVAVALIAVGLYLMRKNFWFGMICSVIGIIAVLAFMNALGKVQQVPAALVAGITSFLNGMGA